MARRKTITREHILNAAYEVVATEGFSGFTARNIASKMKSSTQPIYLEFKNMDELRDAFFERVEDYMRNDIFERFITGDPVIDMAINYVNFAKTDKKLFRSLFIEEHSGGKLLNRFSHDIYTDKISDHPDYKALSDLEKETIYTSCWIAATGLASLACSERINPSTAEIKSVMDAVIISVKSNPDFKIVIEQ